MDRHWLFTWTCYGTWLPGDARGFVTRIRDNDGNHVIHNLPGTPCDSDIPALEAYALQHMKGPPVSLDPIAADAMIAQYQETARIRGWLLQAASVMFNHTHVLVSVPGDPDPDLMLETLKSWATRALKKIRPVPPNNTFWTAKGSNRKLAGDEALHHGVVYVIKKQPNPLAVFHHVNWDEHLANYDRENLASRAP